MSPVSPDASLDENATSEPDATALAPAAAAVRRLISHIRKTTAEPALLERVTREANALADALAPFDHPGPYAQRGLFPEFGPMERDTDVPAEFFPYSPVVGPHNPIAPLVDFQFKDGEMLAEHVFDAQYNGPPTAVHGGIIALVFDELLGCAGVMNDVAGFTGKLEINYRSLTPIGFPIKMRAWIDRNEGRKTWIRGTFHDRDTLCAEAEGLFIRPKESMMADAMAKSAARK